MTSIYVVVVIMVGKSVVIMVMVSKIDVVVIVIAGKTVVVVFFSSITIVVVLWWLSLSVNCCGSACDQFICCGSGHGQNKRSDSHGQNKCFILVIFDLTVEVVDLTIITVVLVAIATKMLW